MELAIENNFVTIDLPTTVQSKSLTENKMEEEDDDETICLEQLKLRDYQMELAENACMGRNCIVVAPTGSGKTHVAMYIMKNHLENADGKKVKKVIFMVPTVALVEQQKSLFEKYLPKKICGITGVDNISIRQLITVYDIFIITPQILENSLREDRNFMAQLTLMIFDECHHAKKDHPYNAVMTRYHDIRDSDRDADLPQIVGLTASVGVGKAKNLEEAKNYVLNICANLNAIYVSTVRKNLKELNEFTNKPLSKTITCKTRQTDPFNEMINAEMMEIEKVLLQNKDINLNSVSERGCDPYVQWLSRLNKQISVVFDQNNRLQLLSYYEFLKMYNDALMINNACRTKDAVSFIKQFVCKFENLPAESQPQNLISLKLLSNWTHTLHHPLKIIADDQRYNNPKLEQLKTMLHEHYTLYPDSRCIIFCKTREMTVALVNWTKEADELKSLNAEVLIGVNKTDQTKAIQDNVMKKFQKGKCKLIIATSVAEEGLDFAKCNLVIRYEHVTNEIATAQTRGRASRAADSKIILIAEKGSNVVVKEEINVELEKMMNDAIDYIQDLTPDERRGRIKIIQKQIKFERSMNEQAKRLGIKSKNDDPYEIRCLKCTHFAANSGDMRTIENAHHVVVDPDVKERITIKPHPRPLAITPVYKKFGKVHCKKCDFDWGIMASYKGVPFPILKICSFIVRNKETREQANVKKWKDVQFALAALTDEDLSAMTEFNKELYADVMPPSID
ncbi:hypothetical protein HELRODRAFT_114400 [Helobdella robusta]|uniref:RNA helicase n=1 Tax=Helobdella robusta TaxID=6412 RepID=T1EG14_HELRO|nr:hypothetical protein HELRODRAFT_114400 [Helobdella robusta]ESN97093.1 hypothetical protein HELRODRAFT_114400 [Helobdella robusta]